MSDDTDGPAGRLDPKPPEAGGIHWELGEARKLIIAAQFANDDVALEAGLHRLVDALVNAAGSGSALQLVPTPWKSPISCWTKMAWRR